MGQLFYWKTVSWREYTWKQNTASCTKHVTLVKVPLASAAITNYVTKITPYRINRYDNMTNQAVPEPQSSLQWQIMDCVSTQTAGICQFYRTTGQPDDVHITWTALTSDKTITAGSGSCGISCCLKCVSSETTLHHTFSMFLCWFGMISFARDG